MTSLERRSDTQLARQRGLRNDSYGDPLKTFDKAKASLPLPRKKNWRQWDEQDAETEAEANQEKPKKHGRASQNKDAVTSDEDAYDDNDVAEAKPPTQRSARTRRAPSTEED